jgi:hypothetical protein
MKKVKTVRFQEGGSTLLLVVFAVVILAVMGAGLLDVGLRSRIIAVRTAQGIAARSAADAGLTKAIHIANESLRTKAWSDSSPPYATNERLPNCDATFSYKVGAHSMSSSVVQSVGQCGPVTKSVSAALRLKGLFEDAIVVRDRLSLMPNTLVSGYNSSDPLDTEFEVGIGTLSTLPDRIPLGPGTVVDGDVFVGVGGDPGVVIGAGGTITGDKYALSQEVELPVIMPPALPDMGMALDAKGATITILPAQSGRYSGVTLAAAGGLPGILEIAGGNVALHITGNMSLGASCELIVRPGSSLKLYVDGDIIAKNSTGFNNEAGNVQDFTLYATGTGEQTFELKAKSTVFGAIYAPNANLELYPSSTMCGAIVANNAVFKSGGNFYYDEALRNVSPMDEGARFVLKYWSEW